MHSYGRPGGRITVARAALGGASPRRGAQARPKVGGGLFCSSLGRHPARARARARMQDRAAHARRRRQAWGCETNRAPHPPAAGGRACIAHHRALYQRPQTRLQVLYALQARRARLFPAAPLLHLSPLPCRAALYPFVAPLPIPQRLLPALSPNCATCSPRAVSLQEPDSISCMHALRRSELTLAALVEQHHAACAYARPALDI